MAQLEGTLHEYIKTGRVLTVTQAKELAILHEALWQQLDSATVLRTRNQLGQCTKSVVEGELNKLLNMRIIEEVRGYSEWVLTIHLVPCSDEKWCMTVDVCRANQDILREKFQILTIEEMLMELNGSIIFFKLDFVLAFHQIQFTRLMFGVSCAPEFFQKCLQMVFQGLSGVTLFFDDFVVFGDTQQKHDQCVHKVIERIQEMGLTLNTDKCRSGLAEMEFLGHIISGKGY
ncbi:hypothetical protein PR048_028646 [Dryococelus australis]|uniref:Reverse transcriptase domain-containing protein n=1 Tax=Dryococelus australis TaxID=614101 RepID=A0ABQ9GDZ0_9NEOP|nr:hypothetical protein PR048_028646 [Dryococelus australis]